MGDSSPVGREVTVQSTNHVKKVSKSGSKKNLVKPEELMTHVIKRPSTRGVLFIAGIVFVSSLGGVQTAFNSLASHIPFTRWKCNGHFSTKCSTLTEGDQRYFNKTTICHNNLKQGLHFVWDFDPHKHFTTEWGLFCGKSKLKNLVTNSFLGGGAVGALVSGFLNDVIGRKSSAMIGLMVTIPATFISRFSPHAYFLSMFRFLQGFGMLLYFTAVYIYVIEISPPKYRVAVSTLYMINWSTGILIAVIAFHLVQNWSALLSFTGCILVLGVVPLLIGPDSPRFQLVTLRREEEARKGLELLFDILSGYSFDFEALNCSLKFHEQRLSERTGLNTFKLHPKFVRQILVLCVIWFVAGFSYYGFTESYSSLSTDVTLSILYSAMGEILACLIAVPPLLYLGRRFSLLMFCLAGGGMFVLMMFPWPNFSIISGEVLIAIAGHTCLSATYNCLYLFTFELAPTTHRGRIFSACQFSARIGSVLGTEASILSETNGYVYKTIFAALLLVAGCITLLTPETMGRPTPDVPIEVEKRDEWEAEKNLTCESDRTVQDLQLLTDIIAELETVS